MVIGQTLVTGVTVLLHVETAVSKSEIGPVITPCQNTVELIVKEMLLIICSVMFLIVQVVFVWLFFVQLLDLQQSFFKPDVKI